MSLPERFTDDPPKRVRVIAEGQFKGQEGRITMLYYDHAHTGSSSDKIFVRLDSGAEIRGFGPSFEAVEDLPALAEIYPGA